MIDMLVGRAAGPCVRYVQDDEEIIEGKPFRTTEVQLTERDWDVRDPEARFAAATEEIGPIDEGNRYDAQWFIDERRNAAALLVFRPSKFQKATP